MPANHHLHKISSRSSPLCVRLTCRAAVHLREGRDDRIEERLLQTVHKERLAARQVWGISPKRVLLPGFRYESSRQIQNLEIEARGNAGGEVSRGRQSLAK